MIYVVAMVFVLGFVAQGFMFWQILSMVIQTAREERRELEDRLMAQANPVTLSNFKSITEAEPGDVSYVDERREAELSPRVGVGWDNDD